jgi:hypothetical protein
MLADEEFDLIAASGGIRDRFRAARLRDRRTQNLIAPATTIGMPNWLAAASHYSVSRGSAASPRRNAR